RLALWVGFFAVVALFLNGVLWPTSTDTSAVPQPWAFWFHVLYGCEAIAFGMGVTFLIKGWWTVARLGRARVRSHVAHLATVWLLAAWWPQDNLYRVSSRTDWPRQAALVYGFNVTLIIAAAVLVWFFCLPAGAATEPTA